MVNTTFYIRSYYAKIHKNIPPIIELAGYFTLSYNQYEFFQAMQDSLLKQADTFLQNPPCNMDQGRFCYAPLNQADG
jgi:hypothetical protein